MALPNVHEQIKDGGLGLVPPGMARTFGIVGNSSGGTAEEIYGFNDPATAEETLGKGTLVERIQAAFALGAQRVKAVRVDPTGGTAADPGTVTAGASNTGTGTVTTSGTPENDRDFKAICTVSGGVGTAKVKISYNGGITYQEERLLKETAVGPPKEAEIDLGNGSKVKFTDAATMPEASFIKDDYWTWQCTEAKPTDAKRIDAAEKLGEDNEVWWILISDASDSTFWASISTIIADLQLKHRYIFFICETDRPSGAETTQEWVSALETEADGFEDKDICICAGWLLLADRTGMALIQNGGGVICGLMASKSKVSESIGWVQNFPISPGISLFPLDLTEALIETLDLARYTTFRSFPGYGFRVTNCRQMANITSDYRYTETLEVVYKAVRLVRTAAVPYIQAGADEAGLIAYQKALEGPLEYMKADKDIVGYELSIPSGQNVTSTGEVKAYLTLIPVPIMRKLTIVFGLGAPKTT